MPRGLCHASDRQGHPTEPADPTRLAARDHHIGRKKASKARAAALASAVGNRTEPSPVDRARQQPGRRIPNRLGLGQQPASDILTLFVFVGRHRLAGGSCATG